MAEKHKVGRWKGGNIAPSMMNPIFLPWHAANHATNGPKIPDLAKICFDASSRRRAEAGSGASTGTCFALAEHFDASRGKLLYKFGDSALQLPLEGSYTTTTGKKTTTLRGHAEICALAQAINSVSLPDSDYTRFLTRIYIELSPCPLCKPQLNQYTDHTVVMYTYTYGVSADMDDWVSDNQAGVKEYGGTFRP